MTEHAIRIEGLTKRYPRSGRTPARRLLGELGRAAAGLPPRAGAAPDEFAAVDDLSLVVAPGEALALIGRNGCGKTTTLRVVAGLLRPDAGRVSVRGRIQALIALGAGFNDRLSGLQNVYNNAAVLGLSARRTRGIVEQVAAFAELEDFLDAPVGTYSSGMKARLGFAVTTHLNPDVLIIDEVLGVGDFAFQNKCAAHLGHLRERGVTILLVSHSHSSVVRLCERAAWLSRGRLRRLGPAGEVVKAYLDAEEEGRTEQRPEKKRAGPPAAAAGLYGPVVPADPAIRGFRLDAPAQVEMNAEVQLRYTFELTRVTRGLNVTVDLFTEAGLKLTAVSTVNGDLLKAPRSGPVACSIRVPALGLNPGRYVLTVSVVEELNYLLRGEVARFTVKPGPRMTWGILDLNPELTVEQPGTPG